ncbi:MAG: hypothetical protein HXS48_09060 [Theionarchaea archaeon]|nr:MAG: hypothetical protein AYK19_04055 [Theionarchaea archaeon DG-70-1]MBU7027080.1 hypothetical protein [Theionarchaea archaeon]
MKTPLQICALGFMTAALVVITLSFSYIFGIDILSRIIPGVPEPPQLLPSSFYYSYHRLLISDVVLPLFYLFGLLCAILKSMTDMLAQKNQYGLRSEFILIEISLIVMAFSLLILTDRMQPAGDINEHLISISWVLCLLTIGTVIISFFYKYFIHYPGLVGEQGGNER